MSYTLRIIFAMLFTLDAALSARADDVDDYIRVSMARQHIPGLSLVVIRDGKVIKAKGYGQANLEQNVQANPRTVYELASVTKPFVATAVLLLVEDGKIRLEDKISTYVENAPEAWKSITVRHLLTHTSGIKDYLSDLRQDFPHDTPPEKIIEAAMAKPLNFTPGEKWSYSNTGYVILGIIVNKVSGKSYDEFLAKRVFMPLGMTNTHRDSPDEIIPNRAVGYLWYGAGGMRNGEFLKYLMTNHGDRGILSTAMDVARWETALSTSHLLTSSSLKEMWAPVKLNDGSTFGYGLGWFLEKVNGHAHIFHPGGAPGSASIISRYPDDKLTLIILTNGGAAYVQSLDLGVAQRYITSLTPQTVAKLNPALLDSYTGYYNAYGFQLLKVIREKNALILDDGGRLTNAFLPLSDNQFVAEDADRGFTITRAVGGEITGMVLRLIADHLNVQRIGPLARFLSPQPDPDPKLTQKIEGVVKAFTQGGKVVEENGDIAPQARKDFARGPLPEFAGIRSISFIAAQDVEGQGIERHGAKVSQVLYYRMLTDKVPRFILIYLTGDGLVTDEDVVDE